MICLGVYVPSVFIISGPRGPGPRAFNLFVWVCMYQVICLGVYVPSVFIILGPRAQIPWISLGERCRLWVVVVVVRVVVVVVVVVAVVEVVELVVIVVLNEHLKQRPPPPSQATLRSEDCSVPSCICSCHC